MSVFSFLALLLSIVPNIANAQTISLICNGYVQVTDIKGTASGAMTIDLDRQTVSSPVGDFRVLSVDDRSISFNGSQNQLTVFGNVDRFTGRMTIFWYQPQEYAKVQAGQQARFEMYGELGCTPSRRLLSLVSVP